MDIPDINQPSHTQSKNDILSLLMNKKNIKNVNIEDNGKVTLKITKITNRMHHDKHTHVPKQGYNGHVILAKSGIWYDNDGRFARPSVLFHELAENYYRTHFGIDYMDKKENHNNGAHSRASFREGFAYNNPDPGCFDNRSKYGSYYYKGKRIW